MKYKNRNGHRITTLDCKAIKKVLKNLERKFSGAVTIRLGRFTTDPSTAKIIIKRINKKSIYLVSKAKSGSQKIEVTCNSATIKNMVV